MSEGNRDLFAHLANENYDKLQLPYEKLKDETKVRITAFLSSIKRDETLKKLKDKRRVCKKFLKGLCKVINCENLHLNPKDIQKNKNKAISEMDQDQKKIVENMEITKKIYDSDFDRKKIIMKYVYEKDLQEVKEEIEDFTGNDKFTTQLKDNILEINFEVEQDAVDFMKIFMDSYIINGRKITLSYQHEQENLKLNEPKPEIPKIPLGDDVEAESLKKILLKQIDKKLDRTENQNKRINLVNY